MGFQLELGIAALLLLASCSRDSAPVTPSYVEKVEGPPVSSLSHSELLRYYAECTQFGRMDDPHVKYKLSYCSAVNRAQEIEGYAKAAPRRVDPNPVKLH